MLLEVQNLRRKYPEFVLEAEFAVAAGEFFSILGPSGSGKTTLLRLIAGFERPDRGRIILGGADVTNLPPQHRRVGMVFQDFALFPHLSVAGNIGYGLKIRGMSPGQRRRRIDELLALTGLDGFHDRAPSSLSGGEKQRVAVARALAADPLVLLLDEPFSALDQGLRRRLRREIRDLQRRAGFTAIFVTHSQEEAFALSDRMLVMSRGRVERVGTPEEVYADPGTEYAAAFLGEVCSVPVRVEAGTVTIDGLAFTPPADEPWPDGPGRLIFRPEQARLEPAAGDDGPWLPVTVEEREFNGPTVTFTVRGRGWTATVLQLAPAAAAARPGQAAWLRVPLAREFFSPGTD